MTKETNPVVSVIVPNYNGSKTIRHCIRSVLASSLPHFELIVVDDDSSDNSVQLVQAFEDPRIRLLVNRSNRGAAYSRNRGIRASRAGLVLLLDADTHVRTDWMEQHLRAHNRVQADLVAGGVQGIHHTLAGQADDFCSWWTSIPGSKDGLVKRLHVPTTNLSIKREVFDTAGYFQESLRYGEDSEFCNRVRKHGMKIYFKPDIVAFHVDRTTLRSVLKHNYGWGTALVENRARNRMEYSWLLPRSYVGAWCLSVPLAFLFTLFICSRWIRHRPSVVLYFPLIFLAKLWETLGMKDSFRVRPRSKPTGGC